MATTTTFAVSPGVIVTIWVALAIGGAIALARVHRPALKLRLVRGSAVLAGLLFLGSLWILTHDLRQLTFAAVAVGLIMALNIAWVRVCPRCAATAYPRNLTPDTFCRRCGASLAAVSPVSGDR